MKNNMDENDFLDYKYDTSFRKAEIGVKKENDNHDEHYEDDLKDHLEDLDKACIPDYN